MVRLVYDRYMALFLLVFLPGLLAPKVDQDSPWGMVGWLHLTGPPPFLFRFLSNVDDNDAYSWLIQ